MTVLRFFTGGTSCRTPRSGPQGLGLLLAFTMVRPLLNSARREGRASTLVAVVLLLVSTIVAALARTPVLAILWGAGALSALAQWQLVPRQRWPR